MTREIKKAVRRVTLDGQLASYWEREAQRFDALAEAARWNWTARSHRRKAERARAQGKVFSQREETRAAPSEPPGVDPA